MYKNTKHLHGNTSFITEHERINRNRHKGAIFWFTGLSGAGKSTLAKHLERKLFDYGLSVFNLDGDNIRRSLCEDLGFSEWDRKENIRRVSHVANLLAETGQVVITSFISPYETDRRMARSNSKGDFYEVFIDSDLETCEQRDPHGNYRKARAGVIKEFTGISAPYEKPLNPDLICNTQKTSIENCIKRLFEFIIRKVQLDIEYEKRKPMPKETV